MRKLLLVQVRPSGDPMASHEQACIRRRFAGRGVELLAHNALAERPDARWLEEVEGVVIGGSGSYSVHHPDSASWVNPLREVLDTALRKKLPGFGVCFGHQLLGLHLGAEVVTDGSRMERGTIPLHRTTEDAVFGTLGQRFHAHTGHTDLVTTVPSGTTLLASTEAVPVQALRMDGAGWWTSQFHPDLAHDEARDRYAAFARALAAQGGDPGESPDYQPEGDESASLLGAWYDEVFD
jgi:GMP synthase (glutamine-hydrolysing)